MKLVKLSRMSLGQLLLVDIPRVSLTSIILVHTVKTS